MNLIQGTKLEGLQQNRLPDVVFTIPKHTKSTIYYAIYIKIFSDGSISYLAFSGVDFMNATNNDTSFT